MAINKVVYGNTTLVDLTEDTATEEDVMEGKTFHDASGQRRTGSATQGGRVQDVEVNGESVVDENGIAEVVVPVSGDVSTTDFFESYTGGKVKSVQMELSPIQDLHGYDSPWVGGAGKNKFVPRSIADVKSANTAGSWDGNSYTYNGVVYTLNGDDDDNLISIKVNGTASESSRLNLILSNLPLLQPYSGMILSGSVSPVRLVIQRASSPYNLYAADSGNGSLIQNIEYPSQFFVEVFNGNTVSNAMIYPMIRLASESDPTFAPYSNICPISGHTQAKVGDDGKNRFNPNSYESFDITGGGAIRYGHEFDSGEYTLINNGTNNTAYYYRIVAKDYSSYGSSVQIANNTSVNVTVDDAHFLRVFTSTWDDTTDKIAVIEGTNETFVPYNGYQITVNLGGTYYSGILDVVTGVFVPDTAGVDLGTLTWTYHDSSQVFYSADITDESRILAVTCDCEGFKPVTNKTAIAQMTENGTVAFYSGDAYHRTYVKCSLYTDAPTFTSAVSGIKLVYELATPTPIQLSPTMVKALVGENHLSAPLEGQEIIEIIARNIAEFNEVIDDENISDKFTYSSEKIEDRLDAYVDKDAVEEKSATTEFETINGGLLSECKVALSPIQDLHGYDNPWVGGAGKNKLPLVLADIKSANTSGTWSGNIYSVSGGTIEVLVDDANNVIGIKPNSTFSATVIFYLVNNYTFKAGSYALNGCPTGGDSSTYELRIGNIIAQDYGSGATYTLGSDTMSMASIIIRSGQDMSGKNFYPMIRLASESDATFEPYSNICPISGHTQVDVVISNPNLIEEMQDGVWLATNGTYSVIAGYCCSKKFRIAPNNTYNVFATADATIGTDNAVLFYDENDNYLGQNTGGIIRSTTVPFTFTAPSNAYYCALDLKVRLSDLLTAEIVADKEQITVNLGGTYYSGILDVVSGVFTPDTAIATVSDFVFTAGKSDGDLAKVEYTPSNFKNSTAKLKCSRMPYVEQSASWAETEPCYTIANNTKLRVYFDGDTLADFQSDFADIQIIYELANPTPIQLSPTMVKALVGENHLSAPLDGQEIGEVKYKEAFDFNDVMKVANYFTLPLQTFTFTNKICNVNDSRVTSNSLVDVYFTSASMSSVEDAGITVESQNGKIVMTAEEQPVGTIQGRIKVVN